MEHSQHRLRRAPQPRVPRWRAGACAAAALLAASACTGGAGGGEDSGQSPSPGTPAEDTATGLAPPGEPETVATGLEVPWGVVPLPGGGALISERDSARILHMAPGGEVSEVGTVEDARAQGEGGLLGITVPPGQERPGELFAYFTTGAGNRIARFALDYSGGGLPSLGDSEVLVEGIPSAAFHNGGRLAFGPDGMLYTTTGDAGDATRSQDTDSLGGKILRMTPEGEPAEGNPFGNLVYSYGHRNVQGLAWDSDGTLFATEFGQNRYDEINVIEPGGNYGWPQVEGVGGDDAPEEFIDPVITWSTDEASPSGAAIAADSIWVAALRGERIWRVPLTGDGVDPVGEPQALFTGDYGRLRTITEVPGGGDLLVSTSNRDSRGDPVEEDDRILRIPLEG
ncbi:PQQ-dependent sugar dehydrogenase [Streptomonospora litoralis]|uniref:Quinoprotein glucose dehydrogenase B n=1 Tax=Streptomonospora litoralis TaxID=2498135 RepID=A0A4V0ZJC3_9ACTN|nr:PQQ-dependent sugar dehydrogenase [Streptomonospora litoralis]QBI52982.1 Quinoprotein glucose dehydrogenase B precursor [Streptomonospora litoralis]